MSLIFGLDLLFLIMLSQLFQVQMAPYFFIDYQPAYPTEISLKIKTVPTVPHDELSRLLRRLKTVPMSCSDWPDSLSQKICPDLPLTTFNTYLAWVLLLSASTSFKIGAYLLVSMYCILYYFLVQITFFLFLLLITSQPTHQPAYPTQINLINYMLMRYIG